MNTESISGAVGGAGVQLVIHMIDDHGDGVPDFNFQRFIGDDLSQSDNPSFPVSLIADAYSGDNSYRCFYIRVYPEMLNINAPGKPSKKMWIESHRIQRLRPHSVRCLHRRRQRAQSLTVDHSGGSPVRFDITALAQGASLLYPYTTTLLEVFVEREPTPLGKVSTIFTFPQVV